MSVSHLWRTLKPVKLCACGKIATQAYDFRSNGACAGVEYFCDGCADVKKRDISLVPKQPRKRRGSRHLHGEFGRSNSDVQSPVSQSIRNWGTKIKARTA